MHDIRLVRDDPTGFDAALARRGAAPAAADMTALDAERRALATRIQASQGRRNEASKAIGRAMSTGDAAGAEALRAEVAALKEALPQLEAQDRTVAAQLHDLLAALPNLPLPEVPEGADEAGNVEAARWGGQRNFAFPPRDHADIGPPLGLDFATGAALSGARFTFLRGGMARLERALGQFMLDRHTAERGYVECAPPLLVRDEAMFGTGQLPKFEGDLFATSLRVPGLEILWQVHEETRRRRGSGDIPDVLSLEPDVTEVFIDVLRQYERRWLIPTAEVSLTNAVAGQILAEAELPIRMTALTPCFRSEAGAAGRDTRGFIRQHQFDKVELVSVCAPEQAAAEHAHMLASAEGILQALDLPYRRMLLCAGDMGFSAEQTYDLEVWLPGQGAYREISSVSRCGAFQARRMNARFKRAGHKGTEFVHTLNGSGLAVGRTLVAVLETYQREDGSVDVPPALYPYMGGITRLEPAA